MVVYREGIHKTCIRIEEQRRF